MRTNRLWRWVAATVVLGLAVLGYVAWIPMRHSDPAKVSALTVAPSLPGLRNHPHATQSDPSQSTFPALRRAAAAAPAATAVDTLAWKGRTAKSSATLVVMVLPSLHDAGQARSDVRRAYLSRTSHTSAGYGYEGPLTLAGVPGASGSSFVAGTSPTTSAATRRAYVVVFSVDRAVLVAAAQGAGGSAKAAVEQLAVAEYHHLRQLGATPDVAETSFPIVASAVYAAVAAAILAAVQLAPWAIVAARERRRAAWEAARRRERASRGAKVVKRRAGRGSAGRSPTRRGGASARARR